MPNPTDRQRSDDQDNAAQIAYWNDRSGAIWTALQERLDALFEPLTALALQAAAPIPEERVVDVVRPARCWGLMCRSLCLIARGSGLPRRA
jgi:hypothetical protein